MANLEPIRPHIKKIKESVNLPGMLAHSYNLSTQEAEAREEDQEFKVTLDYLAILRLFWTV